MPKDSVQFLSVTTLQPNPFQPRNQIEKDEIVELVDSIKQFGVLEPLVVAHTPAGYQIIAGERRWRAATEAGLEEVPVLIKKTSPKGMLEMAIIENVQRVDLNPIERARAFQQLMRDFNFSLKDISTRISKSAPYISNSLKLLTLPDAIKDGLIGEMITEGHARAIAGIQDTKTMIEVYKRILKESASVRRAEELARIYKEQTGQTYVPKLKKITSVNDPQVKKWEQHIKKVLHISSTIKLTRSQQQTRVVITLKGDPNTTQEDLEKLIEMSMPKGK